jgi:hypothetical protein
LVDDDYRIYNEDHPDVINEMKANRKKLKMMIEPCKESFKESLELEDSSGKGYVTYKQLKVAFSAIDL